MVRYSLLACLFVTALTLPRAPDRVDAPIPEPIAALSAPRTAAQTRPPDPDPRSAVARVLPIPTRGLDPRSAVARVFPISPQDLAIRDLWTRPTLLAALPSGAAETNGMRWAGRFDLEMEAIPLSAAAPVPIRRERTRGELRVALPLDQGVDVRVGVRVDVEDQLDAWEVNGTPTVGFEIRF